jgi:putative membrane protein
MAIRLLLAWLHLLGLGIGLGAVWTRAQALRGPFDAAGLKRIFAADTWWGIAAGLWIVTGLIRAFGPFEKGGDYYLHNHLFHLKIGLLVIILVLEIGPMPTLIRWRMQSRRGEPVDTRAAAGMSRVSQLQAVLVILMVAAAVGMARGVGTR